MTAPTEVRTLAASVAAVGLAGSARALPAAPLDDEPWAQLLLYSAGQHIVGHLVEAIASGALPASDGQFAEAVELHRSALGFCVLLEQRLLHAVDVLTAAGIDHRVLKGSAVAHTVYPDPSLRLFGDVDLLVPSDRFDEAVQVLVGAGTRRAVPQLRAGFDRRFGKSTELHYPDAVQLDLHRNLAFGLFGLTLDPAVLFERSTPYVLAGRTLHALGLEERFIHACYHVAVGENTRLSSRRDVAQLLLTHELDTDRVRALAHSWRGEAVLARAIRVTWETFGLADVVGLSAWAERYVPDPQDVRALDSYVGPGRGEVARILAALPALPGLAAKTAFLRALVLPERTYLSWRGHDRLSWLLRSRRALTRRGTT